MKHLCLFTQILAILILISLKQIKAQNSELKYPEEKYFKNIRQITFSGENAEAYWSFDDSKLIFQATNEQWGESCDQIYIIDTNDYSLKQSIPKRISLGEGRTTCSYFLPGDTTVLYASTHLKNAQPVLFAHYMLAYVEMFKRDIIKLDNLIRNTSENPLGSGALAGTSLKIDRNFTTKKLNFNKPTSNSMDAVSDRDYALEFMFVCSINAMHLSRFAEEIIIWNSDIAKMISIKDDMLTGSSMMPQKKNPDSAEIVRGKTAMIISNLNSLFIIMKALPLSFFKDMQDDKKLVFDCNENLIKNLKLTRNLIKAIKPNKKKMYEYALNGFTTATDFAEYLVNKGLSFRDAHKKSAQLVNIAEKMNLTLNELQFDDIKKVCKQIDKDVMKIFDISNSVNSKKSFGGTSKINVIKMLNKSEKEMR